MRAEVTAEVIYVKENESGDFLDIGLRQEGSLNGFTVWAFAANKDGSPGLGQLVTVGETATFDVYIAMKRSKKGNLYQSIQARGLVKETTGRRRAA